MRPILPCTLILLVTGLGAAATALAAAAGTGPDRIEHGRYLVRVAGCNDCHTPGYAMNNGTTPEQQWLTGDQLGWRGPWGTTYGANLRLFMRDLTEDQWVEAARTLQRRPPMPWFNLNRMSDSDLRAIYQFTRSLGEPGQPAPAYVPPGAEPQTPYVQFPSAPPPTRAAGTATRTTSADRAGSGPHLP